MGYFTRTLNYLERIKFFNLTRMMSMADLIAIDMETPRIDSGCSVEKEFTILICIHP